MTALLGRFLQMTGMVLLPAGLMIGLFEPVCAPWQVGGVPEDFSFGTLSPDWDRMGPYLETAMSRIPMVLTWAISPLRHRRVTKPDRSPASTTPCRLGAICARPCVLKPPKD